MFETFIQFISATNTLSAVLVCAAFVIFTLGVAIPIVDAIRGFIWQFIDDKPLSFSTWFVEKIASKVSNLKPTMDRFTVEKDITGGLHIKDNKENEYVCRVWYDGGAITQSMMDRDSFRGSEVDAESRIKSLESYYGAEFSPSTKSFVFTYILRVLGAALVLLAAATLLNYLFMPTLYVATVVASFWALRMIRRLQKKAVETLDKLNKHEALSKDEAHQGESK